MAYKKGNIMTNKKRNFADDCWAVWVAGDDTSTVYINDSVCLFKEVVV